MKNRKAFVVMTFVTLTFVLLKFFGQFSFKQKLISKLFRITFIFHFLLSNVVRTKAVQTKLFAPFIKWRI
jgi:hypothetical protein